MSRGLTLRQVEERVRVSHAYLSQIERGERGTPNLRILKKLAEAYGISLTELVEASDRQAEAASVDTTSPEPDVAFVSKGYENLSKESRRHLSEFLQFLLQKEAKGEKRTND
jgi:transcriptional regulator with XRE-family HTH domain